MNRKHLEMNDLGVLWVHKVVRPLPTSSSRTFSAFQKETPSPSAVPPKSPSLRQLTAARLLSVSERLPALDFHTDGLVQDKAFVPASLPQPTVTSWPGPTLRPFLMRSIPPRGWATSWLPFTHRWAFELLPFRLL